MHLKRLEQRILKSVNHACRDFDLIAPGDKILVAMSGGKDSYALLWALRHLQAAAPFEFEVFPFHLDQGQPGHDVSPIKGHLEAMGIPFEIEVQDTYSRVIEKVEEGKVYCSLCSRFRRAILYKAANRNGCNKVALGHHADDLVETVLLNMFFAGQIKTMPPKLISEDGSQMVIRPLAYVAEAELIELAEHHAFPIMPCNLCGSQERQRKAVKNLLTDLDTKYPEMRIKQSILASLGNVRPTHLLDPKVNPLFATIGGSGVALDDEGGCDEGEAPSTGAVVREATSSRLPILS